MKINLDYKISKEDSKTNNLSPQELTEHYIGLAVNHKYKDGIEGSLRRMWGRIQRKLDEGIEKKLDEITLEEGEVDFISKAFDGAKFPPFLSKYVQILEDEIDKLIKK